MKIIPLNLGGGTSLGRHPAAGSTRLLNCYLEKVGAEQKSSDQIWAADGLAIFGRLTGGERMRAFLEVDGTLYVVCGRRIFSVSPTGDETDLGGIATSGPVYMARNRRSPVQIAIVSDGVYMVIASGTLTTVAHPIAPPTSVCFMDGYFVFSHADGRISHTASDDAMTIDPLAWGAVETSPDSTTRVVTSERHVIAFGPASIKRRPVVELPPSDVSASDILVTFAKSGKQLPWQPTAGSLLEFAEANGLAVDSGCRAGGCGTCQTTIKSGEVAYLKPPDYDPEPGSCLLCVCAPRTSVTLEA
jgi:ferredoxin